MGRCRVGSPLLFKHRVFNAPVPAAQGPGQRDSQPKRPSKLSNHFQKSLHLPWDHYCWPWTSAAAALIPSILSRYCISSFFSCFPPLFPPQSAISLSQFHSAAKLRSLLSYQNPTSLPLFSHKLQPLPLAHRHLRQKIIIACTRPSSSPPPPSSQHTHHV
jgi:hypothetical protein